MSNIQTIKNIEIFFHLTNDALTEIDKYLRVKNYSKGEMVYLENDIVDRLLILKEGKVEIYKNNENGKKLTLWYVKPYEPFCLAAFTLNKAIYNARVIKKSSVYYIYRNDAEKIFKKYPEIYTRVIELMSHRFLIKSKILENVALNDTKVRIFNILTNKDYMRLSGEKCVVSLNQSEIASLSGVCRETVCRILSKLKKEGILNIEQKRITIKNFEKLQSYCSEIS